MTKARRQSPYFERVAILGVGLLGASLGLALKRRGLAGTVVGVGRPGSESLGVAKRRRAIDVGVTDPAEGAGGADLVVLCTPVRQFPGMLRLIGPSLKRGAVVTDVGSTKAQVMKWAGQLVPRGVDFVGSHPMAGSEKRGPEFARADLYENAVCLLCGKDSGARRKLQALWGALGMKTICLDAVEHDRWVAAISHLPHAAATCLVMTAAEKPEALAAIAGGFIDTTRIASSDVDMWTDIFLTNRHAVSAALGRYARRLAGFRKAVEAGDERAIRHHLTWAQKIRNEIVARRGGR